MAAGPADASDAAAVDGGNQTRRRYVIDVRIFLAVITTSMALSFFAGVAFGPTPADLDAVRGGVAHLPETTTPSIPASAEIGNREEDDEEEEDRIVQPRRLPTAHSAELGARADKLKESHVNFHEPSYEDLGDGAVRREVDLAMIAKEQADEDGDDDHLPQGQHLLVDIKNVEADFLNSEDRLAHAMVSVVKAGGLTLLSYHCHSLMPAGVSCVGVLLESHVSFHTWPEEGVITLDLFTCGSAPLVPVVPQIEELFGVPRAVVRDDGTPDPVEKEKIITKWSHELRGFRHPKKRTNDYLDNSSDLSHWVLSPLVMSLKKQIVSTLTPFQRIDIWDVIDEEDTPSYQDAMKYDLQPGDPRWLSNEIVMPDRLLFLDGTLQSISESEREYHEALVHPGMIAHPNPKRVAIIGGGEGAPLREVLKYNTLEKVIMIEIDEEMVELSREHLPFMNDCSNLVGRAKNCFDDEIVNVLYEDGRQWFVDHFSDLTAVKEEDKFDVIILDALDPEEKKKIADHLYTDDFFFTALSNALTEEGIFVVQIGTAPSIHDPKPDIGVYSRRETMFNLLEAHESTAAMLVYEESHCGFLEPHSFMVVCKNPNCRHRWYAESDAIDYQVYKRTVDTVDDEAVLVHFDGSTQHSYQMPPRGWESVYCRREPTPFECAYRGLDLDKEIFSIVFEDNEMSEEESSFTIEFHEDENGLEQTKIYASEDIPKGSYIMADDLASSFKISDESVNNLKRNAEISETGQLVVIEGLLEYIEEHGHRSMAEGMGISYVEIGGTFMMRKSEDKSEVNVGRWIPPHPSGKIPAFSPVYDRHMHSFDVFLVASKDIKKGEEVVKPVNLWV